MKKGLILCASFLIFLFLMPVRAFAANGNGQLDLDGTNWMTGLPDDRYLYEINIPGAHDAATASVWHEEIDYLAYDVEPYLEPFAKAQDKSIGDLLDSGVRALDLRLTNWIDGTREKDGVLILAHGDESNGFCFRCMERLDLLTLTKVLDEVTAFLDEHPTETVILKVKEEYDDGKHKPVWGSIKSTIQDYDKSTGGKKLYIEDRWPTRSIRHCTIALPQCLPGNTTVSFWLILRKKFQRLSGNRIIRIMIGIITLII